MFNQDLEVVVIQQSLVKPRNPIWHLQEKCKFQGEINMLQEMSKKKLFWACGFLFNNPPARSPQPRVPPPPA